MKKLIILICVLLQAVVVLAETVEIDGLRYDLNMDEKTASISSGNSYKGILVIPEIVTYQDIDYSVTTISGNAFIRNYGLLSVTIPNSVKKIGSHSFYECPSLASVKIGDGVETIGNSAFTFCGIVSIIIGNKVNFIDGNAFSGCSKITQVYISDLAAWCRILFGDLTSNPLFYSRHLYLDKKEVKELVIPEGITEINSYAFAGASNILSLAINDEVTSIGDNAFNQCTSLNKVTFGNALTLIGAYAFNDCSSLESIQMTDGITTIEEGAFKGCSKLENLKLPENLKIIKGSAFQDCNSLTNLIIPSKVEFIYYSTFHNTSGNKLSVIMMPEYPPLAYDNSFPNGTKLYVPDTSIEPYESVAPWSNMEIATFSSSGPEKCAMPEIVYKKDKISFNCETPDVEFHYTITTKDIANRQKGKETTVSAIYQVSVYATKEGYENSDLVTSEINIKGIKGDLTGDGIVNVADHVELSNIIMTQQENGTDN